MATGPTERARGRAAPLYPLWLAAVALLLWGLFVSLGEVRADATVNDADGDGVVDTADVDDDNDGVPDLLEIAADGSERDSDADGMPDRLDLDSDNDGLLDWQESGAVLEIDLSALGLRAGRLVGPVGSNGLLDHLEAPVDSGQPRYSLADSDAPADALPDMLDLDADNDGLPDLLEAGVPAVRDADRDGRIDAPIGSVGNDGIADYLQPVNDASCCDVDGDGREDALPIDSDLDGLPDHLDADSDDDGVSDLLEAGGTDVDGDGRVDDFIDIEGGPDGYDDAYRAVPLGGTDLDGNGRDDRLDAHVVGSLAEARDAGVIDPGVTAGPPNTVGLTQVYRDDASTDAAVLTGVNASGCSIGSTSFDVITLASVLLSLSVLGWRRGRRRVRVRRTAATTERRTGGGRSP